MFIKFINSSIEYEENPITTEIPKINKTITSLFRLILKNLYNKTCRKKYINEKMPLNRTKNRVMPDIIFHVPIHIYFQIIKKMKKTNITECFKKCKRNESIFLYH